jgi:urea carboxylase-associated protein 2
MLVFNAERPVERLNVADTIKVQWSGYLGAGKALLSDMGRALMSIIEDGAATHDAFCGASNLASNTQKYGLGDNYGPQPNARDRFLIALTKYGLGRKDVHPCINWFKGVAVEADGATTAQIGPFAPGRTVTLRADMNVIVVLANCPHVLDPRDAYAVKPARVQAWRGAPAGEDDAVRRGAPELERAFANVDEYYAR